ncbi:MAG: diiron oxygenase [Actinomycetota bacterium]|nr:diiron oxygenase [Actinomycetota bacterium]
MLTRMVSKIHVTEEARHIRYAREELARIMPKTSPAQRAAARWLSAAAAHRIATNLIHPEVYRSVGLDPKVARKVARNDPHHQETIRWTARKVVPFLSEQGMIGASARSSGATPTWSEEYELLGGRASTTAASSTAPARTPGRVESASGALADVLSGTV